MILIPNYLYFFTCTSRPVRAFGTFSGLAGLRALGSPSSPAGFSCTYFGFCCVSFFIALKIYSSAGVPVLPSLRPKPESTIEFQTDSAAQGPPYRFTHSPEPPLPPSTRGDAKAFAIFMCNFLHENQRRNESVACGSLRLRGGGCFFSRGSGAVAATDNRRVD